jgi:hypothetical protein
VQQAAVSWTGMLLARCCGILWERFGKLKCHDAAICQCLVMRRCCCQADGNSRSCYVS